MPKATGTCEKRGYRAALSHGCLWAQPGALPPFGVPPLGGPRGASSIYRPAERGTGHRNERVETCLLRRPTKYIGTLLPTWRNWQTRQTQNLVLVRVCGFDPLRRHHLAIFNVVQTLIGSIWCNLSLPVPFFSLKIIVNMSLCSCRHHATACLLAALGVF